MRRSPILAALAAFAALTQQPRADPPAELGLPPLPALVNASAAAVELGRKLFMDRRLSRNGTMSCAMCHVPEQGFAANELATAVGMEGRSLRRNAPTLLNVGYQRTLFHDGRAASLESQVWSPLLAPDEMANGSPATLVRRIRELPEYAPLFAAAFPSLGVSAASIEQALAGYQRTLVSAGSRFDRWWFAGEREALSREEQEGFALFTGKARCTACHAVEDTTALFTDHRFHDTGVGWAARPLAPRQITVPLAAGVSTDIDLADIAALITPERPDEGRYEITGDTRDQRAFKTPSLRNVALTAPYMHNGSIASLEGVVEHYARGGTNDPNRDPALRPLALSAAEKRVLAAFLRSLTGANVEHLAREARAADPSSAARERAHAAP